MPPFPGGGALVSPELLGPPTCVYTVCMRNNNQILHDDETRCEEKFSRSTTNADV